MFSIYKAFQGSLQTFFFKKFYLQNFQNSLHFTKNLFAIDKLKVYNWQTFWTKFTYFIHSQPTRNFYN